MGLYCGAKLGYHYLRINIFQGWSLAHGHLELVHNGGRVDFHFDRPACYTSEPSLIFFALRTALVAATITMLDVTSVNSTDVGSTETATNLLNDRINLIAATTLLGVTYGIMSALFCMTTYSLLKKLLRRNARSGSHSNSLSRSRTEWRKTLLYLVYTSILFVLATLYAAGNSQNAIVAYVDNRLYPGGPYQYYITFMVGQTVMVMTDVTSLIILWMTDALIVSVDSRAHVGES